MSPCEGGYGLARSNDGKVANKGQKLIGHGEEALGKATGDKGLEQEGKADQVRGNLKQAGEKIKDAFK